MAIVSSEKVFVDPKEEVTIILERILKSEKSRVILVVPLNSLLLSSYVTINILFREITRSPKLTIIVTEDEYGAHISKKAGFEVVQKVSQVTSTEWERALMNKKELLDSLALRKKTLLQNFQGDQPMEEMENPIAQQQEAFENKVLAEPAAEVVPEVPEVPSVLTTEMTEPEAAGSIEPAPIEELPVPEAIIPVSPVAPIDKSVEESEAAMVKKFMKPRREAKIMNIDGIEILSGGDIVNMDKPKVYDKIAEPSISGVSQDVKIEDFNRTESKTMNLNNSEDAPSLVNRDLSATRQVSRNIPPRERSNFTGKDFTKAPKGKVNFGGFFKFFGDKGQTVTVKDGVRTTTNKSRRKTIAIAFGVVLFLLLSGGYVLAFQASSVNISLQLKKEDVSTSASIIVDTTATGVTLDPLTIPGISLKQDNLSISRTGQASGTGQKGDKASGLVDLINLTSSEIVLNAGTKVTSTSSNLVYLLRQNTTLPPCTFSGGVCDAHSSRVPDVQLDASDLGEQYNIAGSDSNTIFVVDGYTRNQIQATRYVDFTGGTSTPFVAVSADDVKTVKTLVTPDITKDGETKLQQQVPAGYRYLPETLTFVEDKSVATPDVGQESTDKTFNYSLTGSVTAVAVKETDLQTAITHLVEQNNSGNAVTVQGINDLKIDKVDTSNNKLVLTVSSKSSLQQTITADEVKKNVAGKSVTEANGYLALLAQVDKYQIVFSPGIVPLSIQRIPTDLSRITVKTQ